MTLIKVQPDTEWVEEPRRISFEAPAEIGRIMRNSLSLPVDKQAAMHTLFGFAYRAIQDAMSRPDLAQFEICTSKNPWGLARDDSQLTMEEEVSRLKSGEATSTFTSLFTRDMENWVIWVLARRKARLFIKYPDVLGHEDGLEDFEDLPATLRERVQPIYEEVG